MDQVNEAFDAAALEHTFELEVAGRNVRLESHRMVFNPTAFGLTLALIIAERIERGMKVCEVGIGSGVLCILAGLTGARVTGLDINPHAVHMARRNWRRNGLPDGNARFMQSEIFNALPTDELATFDMVWSNPPLLPRIESLDQTIHDREGFEVAGDNGRSVLDGVLSKAQRWLRPGGRLVTIATSLQGWQATARQLDAHWTDYQVVREVEIELTDECTPPYIAWWQAQEAKDGEVRVYQRAGKWLHKLWFVEAIA